VGEELMFLWELKAKNITGKLINIKSVAFIGYGFIDKDTAISIYRRLRDVILKKTCTFDFMVQ
jgi:Icc-related predicted phosphoesterase